MKTLTHKLTRSTGLLLAMLLLVAAPAAAQTTGQAIGQGAAATSPSASLPGPELLETLDAETLDQVRLLLSGYHAMPEQKALDELMPNARDIMFAMATSPKIFELHRERALATLVYWPSPAVHDLYVELLGAATTSDNIRHQLMGHLARGFGAQAVTTLAAYLEVDDLQLRLSAVGAIATIKSDEARAVLEKAAANDKSPVVVDRIHSLTRDVR